MATFYLKEENNEIFIQFTLFLIPLESDFCFLLLTLILNF